MYYIGLYYIDVLFYCKIIPVRILSIVISNQMIINHYYKRFFFHQVGPIRFVLKGHIYYFLYFDNCIKFLVVIIRHICFYI